MISPLRIRTLRRVKVPGATLAAAPIATSRGDDMATLDKGHRDAIPQKEFAFPKQRKEPLEDASHVRNAIARFNQVEGVTDEERDDAWKRIKSAARKFDVEVGEGSWREIGKHSGHGHK
jgi:hypothetical protein